VTATQKKRRLFAGQILDNGEVVWTMLADFEN
jgi:hypothetical protein